MNHLEFLQNYLSLGFAGVLCAVVFARKAQRVLPFFAAYVCVILFSAIAVGFTYQHFGFRSAPAYYAYWIQVLLNTVARGLVIVELCRYGFCAYRGIWALVWRVLSFLAILFLAHAAWDAWGQPNRLAIYGLTLERDLDVASVSILVLLLFIRNYYGIAFESPQWGIALGICFFCAVGAINNTIVRNLYAGGLFSWFATSQRSLWPSLKAHIDRINDLYGTVRMSSFVISMGIWCFALRKPLSGPAKDPVLLPAEVYRELSPAINFRLRALNDRLAEMLKP